MKLIRLERSSGGDLINRIINLNFNEMKTKMRLVIMSYLSDVQDSLTSVYYQDTNRNRLNFAKWLLLKYPDTSVEIDADTEFSLFMRIRSGMQDFVNQYK